MLVLMDRGFDAGEFLAGVAAAKVGKSRSTGRAPSAAMRLVSWLRLL